MKFTHKLIVCLLSISLLNCNSKLLPDLKTERIYESRVKANSFKSYLKFYNDSTVIAASVIGQRQNTRDWFHRDQELVSKGKYKIKNDSIFFNVSGNNGELIFKGVLIGKKINLTIRSSIVGMEKFERIYKLLY